ncbi:9933_t:CDS:2, partial [Ambispora gerdemannii]
VPSCFVTPVKPYDSTTETFCLSAHDGKYGFLNECDAELFTDKIGYYLTSLENIIKKENGKKREKAQELFDRYKQARTRIFFAKSLDKELCWGACNLQDCLTFKTRSRPGTWPHRSAENLQDYLHSRLKVDLGTRPDRQLARDWQSRKSKETAGPSVHLHYPTFKGSSLGIGTVNGGTFNAGLSASKKRDQEEDDSEERAFKKIRQDTGDIHTTPPPHSISTESVEIIDDLESDIKQGEEEIRRLSQ